jgi:hypothetical protein
MSDENPVDPLWSLALGSVLPALAEQDIDTFCSTVLRDQRIRDRMRRELLYQPRHTLPELAETDVVELCQVSHEWRNDNGREEIGQDFNLKLVHLGALPFRIREAVRQLFRERHSTTHKTKHGTLASDGRYQLWVEVDEHTDLSDCYEVLEDAYMRALDKLTFEECIPYPSDYEEVDITDQYCVQPDTALYDAYDLTLNDQATQIREAITEDCLCFFADDGAFKLPDTVQPQTVSSHQVWVRKPRVRIVLGGCRRI